MPMTAEQLYALLPAVYRLRDAERGEPLKALLAVLAEEAAIVEDDITRMYDNWFIETCDEWVVPYIGDLLAVRGLYSLRDSLAAKATVSNRARVANTISYRRRKGTAAMLEQLARDVTGWEARVVEYFQWLATTQNVNHPRPHNLWTPDLRQSATLERLNTPFDTIAHTADVRHISNGRGKHNIPNVGVFLWRLRSFPLTLSPAVAADTQGCRYFISPLGCDAPLFTHPIPETEITHLAEPLNVPEPIPLVHMCLHLDQYYGEGRSLLVTLGDGTLVDRRDLTVCSLADVNPNDPTRGWTNTPPAKALAVDPTLGRLAFREPQQIAPRVTWHRGHVAELGGGGYDRPEALGAGASAVVVGPAGWPSMHEALANLGSSSLVAIVDSGRYVEADLAIDLTQGQRLEIRSANEHQPALVLTHGLEAPPAPPTLPVLHVVGATGATLTLDGLLVLGGSLRVSGPLERLTLRHCTLQPGWEVSPIGKPLHGGRVSLVIVGGTGVKSVEVERCVVGPLDLADAESVVVRDSIVDGGGNDALSGSGAITIERCTVLGTTSVETLELASESIFTGELSSRRQQVGCVRFCYVPVASKTPRRYRCQPDLALEGVEPAAEQESICARLTPAFTSLRYGDPAFAQLSAWCAAEISTGAEDGSEMGAFSLVKQAHRVANLRTSLDEYLRFGLEAGIFFAT